MKIKTFLLLFSCVALLSSCAVTFPYAVTNNAVGTKTGVSSTTSFFSKGQSSPSWGGTYHGIILNSKFSIADAAKNGKISKIGSVDLKTTSYVFFTKREYIVTGE